MLKENIHIIMQSLHLQQYQPEFKVIINGNEDQQLRHSIIGIQVSEELQSPSRFTLTVIDKYNVDSEEFVWLDNPILQPKQKLSIQLGYVDNLAEIITNGEIATISTTGLSQGDIPRLTITGYDATHDFFKQNPIPDENTTSKKLTGGDIVDKISDITGNSAKKSPIEKEYAKPVTKNQNNTHGAILRDRAKSIGFEFFLSRNVFHYVNPRLGSDVYRTLTWGKNIMRITPTLNASDLVTDVQASSTGDISKNAIKGKSAAGNEDKIGDGLSASEYAKKISSKSNLKEIVDKNYSEKQEAEQRAKAELNIAGDNLITVDGTIVGDPDLELGKVLEIKKIGAQFSGKFYVTKVNHVIDDGGYVTSFGARRNTINELK